MIHQNQPMPCGLTGSRPNSRLTNSSWSKCSSGRPSPLAYADSDHPVSSSAPHSGQSVALGGSSAPQFGQTSGTMGIYDLRHAIYESTIPPRLAKLDGTRKSQI